MSTLLRISVLSNWPDQLRKMFPGVTLSDLEEFHDLIRLDLLLDDDGQPTEALLNWCARALRRGGTGGADQVPVPGRVPGGPAGTPARAVPVVEGLA